MFVFKAFDVTVEDETVLSVALLIEDWWVPISTVGVKSVEIVEIVEDWGYEFVIDVWVDRKVTVGVFGEVTRDECKEVYSLLDWNVLKGESLVVSSFG